MRAGKIDLVPFDAVILQEKLFVPVAGPALIHDLGSDLGLKKQRGLADDFDDRFHPAIIFFI